MPKTSVIGGSFSNIDGAPYRVESVNFDRVEPNLMDRISQR